MLIRKRVFNQIEIESRYNTKVEQYITSLEIETEAIYDLMNTKIIPTAITFQGELLDTVIKLRDLGDIISGDAHQGEIQLLQKVTSLIKDLNDQLSDLHAKMEKAEAIEDDSKKAKYFSDEIVPALETVRIPADALEAILPDSDWPLPKYSEMLFIM